MVEDKSLEDLRAVIDKDIEDAGTLEDEKSKKNEDESDLEEKADSHQEDEDPKSDKDEDKSSEEEEWVIPNRCKTVDDLKKSYSDLESEFSRRNAENAQLRKQAAERNKATPAEQEAELVTFNDNLKKDPIGTLRRLAREEVGDVKSDTNSLRFEQAYFRRKNEVPDFDELEPIMTQIATHYGDMIQASNLQNDPRLLEILEYAARGVKSAQDMEKVHNDGVEKGKRKAKRKAKASIEGGSGNSKETGKIDTSKLSSKQMKELFEKGELK